MLFPVRCPALSTQAPGAKNGSGGDYETCPDSHTWDALALDSPGDDGERLMAGLTQHLTQLLHAVAVHDDGVPAVKTEEARCQRRTSDRTMRVWKRYSVEVILLEFPKVNTTFILLVLMMQHHTQK